MAVWEGNSKQEGTIKKLLAEPFGPYRDSDVLTERCTNTTSKPLTVTGFMMALDGRATGLDETDFKEFKVEHPRFRAVLEIKHLNWLTPLGFKYLEKDLKDRDIRRHIQTQENPKSNLTLRELYKWKGFRLKVTIQGVKPTRATYTSDGGLYVKTHDRNRSFIVKSMDVETYTMSQNFFMRYKIVALLEAINTYNPDIDIQDRTVNYFVEQYRRLYAAGYEQKALHHRLIYNSDDSDVDSAGNTERKRHLRPVHRNEILDLFASQAEWILMDQIDRTQPLINIHSWNQFCRDVKIARREARRSKDQRARPWGQPFGDVSSSDESDAGIDFTKAGLDPKKVTAKRKKLKGKLKKKVPEKHTLAKTIAPESVVSEEEEIQTHQNIYDSDFSVDSSDAAPPSSDDEVELENPYIAAIIPIEIYHPPANPGPQLRFDCSILHCTHSFDLLKPTTTNTDCLDAATKEYLVSKQWRTVVDEKIVWIWRQMISNHYEAHIDELGLKWARSGLNHVKLVWKDPKNHPPWPPAHFTEEVGEEAANELLVKAEESEVSVRTSPRLRRPSANAMR